MSLFSRFLLYLRGSRRASLGLVLALVTTAIVGNTLAFYFFEARANPDIGLGDALWYSVISITTIGYGDYSASHIGSRLATVFFVVIIGLTAFTLLLGTLADFVTEFVERGKRGMAKIVYTNHILIVNFPSAPRVRQVIRELSNDPQNEGRQIVILTDRIESLPFDSSHVSFVHGSPIEEESYEQANLAQARMALILATDYNDPQSDAVVSSCVMTVKRMRPDIFTVAESIDERHADLFAAAGCDSVVCGLTLSCNVLVQELHDPGIAQTLGVVCSNLITPTLYSTSVDGAGVVDYTELAKSLLDRGANILSVIRGDQTFTTFRGLTAQDGDRVVYLADQRYDWGELQRL